MTSNVIENAAHRANASGLWYFNRLEPTGTLIACAPSGERYVVKNGNVHSEAFRQLFDAMVGALTTVSAMHWTEAEPVRLSRDRFARVYLAGPMTGLPDLNFPAFNAEAAMLRAKGLTVINPAEHGIVAGAEWADYLRHDLAGLMSCERIHLLPGWSKSKGANLEVLTALVLGSAVTLAPGAEAVEPAGVLSFVGQQLGYGGLAHPLVVALAAVQHAVESCKNATGQRRVIDMFVNKIHLANEVVEALRDTKKTASAADNN